MFDVLIKNAKIVSSQEIIEGNLYIRDEKIAAVSRDLLDEGAAKVIDAAGKYAMPGVADEHVHIIDMGQPELGKYELDSGGAAVGGITTVLEMPLSMPPSTTLENFKKKEERAGSAFMVDYGLYGGAVPGNLEEMYKINDAGCIGFKAMMAGSVPDMFDVADDGSLLEIFRAIKEMDSTIGVHAENDALIHIEEQHLKAQGRKDITAYLDSRSEFQENEAVRRAIYLNSDPECCLIIVHASNPGAVWYVLPGAEDENGIPTKMNIYPTKLEKTENGEVYVPDMGKPEDKMTFENIYTYNHTTQAQRPAEKPNTPEPAITAPKTFDAGVALYGVSALLSLTGTALVIKRKNG